jgi:probable HAF family extracellular repeat protein
VIDLGTLGGRHSQAYDINDAGEIVGWSDMPGNTQRHAFSWRDDNGNGASDPGEMVDLGHLGGGNSIAYGINAVGQIVGTSATATFASHAFRTTADGVINPDTDDLGTLGGISSTAYRINGAGQVAGHSQTFGNLTNHAFRTAANSPINPSSDGLGSLGGTRSEAWGINASGQVVGWSFLSGSTTRTAFYSSGSGMVRLNTLVDPALGWNLDAAFAINDSSQIVGSGSGPAGASRAFRAQFPMSLNPDFNGDGKIDAADLDQWLVNFGLNGDSDADGDGDTDGADFLAWQLQLSAPAGEAQSSIAAPEPAASLLGATGLAVLKLRRARSAGALRYR